MPSCLCPIISIFRESGDDINAVIVNRYVISYSLNISKDFQPYRNLIL